MWQRKQSLTEDVNDTNLVWTKASQAGRGIKFRRLTIRLIDHVLTFQAETCRLGGLDETLNHRGVSGWQDDLLDLIGGVSTNSHWRGSAFFARFAVRLDSDGTSASVSRLVEKRGQTLDDGLILVAGCKLRVIRHVGQLGGRARFR
jgi:hypothetical protein